MRLAIMIELFRDEVNIPNIYKRILKTTSNIPKTFYKFK